METRSVSNRVAEMRSSAGVTQEGLALAVGVSRQTISALEKGNYIPSVLLAIAIAEYFNRPVEELFYITYE